ncbi:uncharacterized protein EV420DRAFT_1651334 [Desarmillaria tabescens]|uniref:Uncharacterized protein n=1 Tax=Armillaria tabescens TaxID=1929756 RepID=A0AA39J9K7_ARMTA|nr:uncharacterized protein EV420DRAFT_1651334 [Desarmillaria tabescens]KAK0438682.1 hypothetical protein EV420DRAFT_1651334 [Desarmillaria tabescens]
MSFETLRSLWPTLTPMFSPGATLTIPAMRCVQLLKEAAPAAVGILKAARARPNIEYRGFALNLAYTLSLVAIEISKEMYDERWDELSLTPHEAPYAIRFSVHEPAPKFMPRSSQTVPTPSGSSSKGKSKTQASMVSIKKPQKFAKGQTAGPTSMPEDKDDENDAGNSLDEESVVVVKPFRPPASQGSPSKHIKPGPNCHSVAAVPPSVNLPVGVVEEQVIHTRGEKRKREAAIATAESHVETSNVRDESPELPKKMMKQHMAQLGRQAAAQVPSRNIAFDPITMRPVDADEVRWLATATMDPKVPCSLCAVGSQSKPCEFMGWGVPCGNCQRGKKVYLVKAFDSACETAGRLSELLCNTCKDIDAVIRDTVEYEGHVVAEESLVTDVSAVNGLLDGFSAQEVEVSTTPENEDQTGPSLFSLSYDASFPKRDEALRREEGGGGEMDADGDLDAEV